MFSMSVHGLKQPAKQELVKKANTQTHTLTKHAHPYTKESICINLCKTDPKRQVMTPPPPPPLPTS